MGNPGGEGVTVRAGECRIGIRPRVTFRRPVDLADQSVNAFTPKFLEKAGPFPVPVAVGQILLNPYDRKTTALTPADNFIHRIGFIVTGFDGNPGIDGEPAAPAPGRRSIYLEDSFSGQGWIRGHSGGFTACGSPIFGRTSRQANKKQEDKESLAHSGEILTENVWSDYQIQV